MKLKSRGLEWLDGNDDDDYNDDKEYDDDKEDNDKEYDAHDNCDHNNINLALVSKYKDVLNFSVNLSVL